MHTRVSHTECAHSLHLKLKFVSKATVVPETDASELEPLKLAKLRDRIAVSLTVVLTAPVSMRVPGALTPQCCKYADVCFSSGNVVIHIERRLRC
jgi:hypothetical protein